MRSAVFLAACIALCAIASTPFTRVEAQTQYQAPQGEARQRLIRRALGLPETSTISQIAEVTARRPHFSSGGNRAWLAGTRINSWHTESEPDTGWINIVRPMAGETWGPVIELWFRALPGRHLIICDMRRNDRTHAPGYGAFEVDVSQAAQPGVTASALVWETQTRGAILVSRVNEPQDLMLRFAVPPSAPEGANLDLFRCEVSRINA